MGQSPMTGSFTAIVHARRHFRGWAVLSGTPPIVGKAAFHDFVKQALAKSPAVKVVKYAPDIHDIQVAGNVAYEWGYFDTTQKSFEQQAPESLRAKLLRVMRRQPDGSWKFARVMWLPD